MDIFQKNIKNLADKLSSKMHPTSNYSNTLSRVRIGFFDVVRGVDERILMIVIRAAR